MRSIVISHLTSDVIYDGTRNIMIVKNPQQLQLAEEVFGDTDITIDLNGERHLGAAIGSSEFKEKYVQKKIDNWIKDVEQLLSLIHI